MMFRVALIILTLQVLLSEGAVAASGNGAVKTTSPPTCCNCPPGRDGRDGIVGPHGLSGFPGFNGHKGQKGQVGNDGVLGLQGRVGLPGPLGPAGNMGAKGDRGPAGLTGTIGTTGSTGSPGVKGDRGPVGLTGARGYQGSRGYSGFKGVKGQRGLTGPPGSSAPIVGGVTYNRWGKSSCRYGVERVYPGRTGVSYSGSQGGSANYVCMPNDPEYTLSYRPGVQGHSFVYGAEYELPLVSGRFQHNAPCAVCYIPTKHTVIMIPAKTSCPSGWTREYYGYLMSERVINRRTMYECVDIAMESIPGSQNHIDGGHFYHVEAHCNGMACPPYNNYKELNCVVCSK